MTSEDAKIILLDPGYIRFIDGFAKMAQDNDLEIVPFDDIDDGLAYLQTEPGVKGVLLSLAVFPDGRDGRNALGLIKRTLPLLPVITLCEGQSAKELEQAVKSIQEGAFTYFIKKKADLFSLFQVIKVAAVRYVESLRAARLAGLKATYDRKAPLFRKMIETSQLIVIHILRNGMAFPPSVEMRLKDFDSFYTKILEKEAAEGPIADPFERFTDLAGLRLIFYNADDLDKAVKLLLAADDFVDAKTARTVVPDDKSKEYGYRAIHFDIKLSDKKRIHLDEYSELAGVPLELQFKTIFAHSWSKIYHAVYKGHNHQEQRADQAQLSSDFAIAAKNLEDIEQLITNLCEKYQIKSTVHS